MINIQKAIALGRQRCEEDMYAAEELMAAEHVRQSLALARWALEGMLKANVMKATQDIPPKMDDLLRLAELAKLSLTPHQKDLLAEFQAYSFDGPPPESEIRLPSPAIAQAEIGKAKEMFVWLMKQL